MIEQRKEALHNQRKGLIKASSVGAILGYDPYRTTENVMRQMVREWQGLPNEFTGNIATEWGSYNEDTARAQYELSSGFAVETCGFFVSDVYPWLVASPDGLIGDQGLIEIKCPYGLRDKENPEFKSLKDQQHYYDKIQALLLCTHKYYAAFYQWAPYGESLEYVSIDMKWRSMEIPRLKEFYDRYLEERDKLIIDEINTADAKKLIDEYLQLDDAISLAGERKKEVLVQLVKLAGDKNSVICGHKLTKVERAGAISYAKAAEQYLKNIDLEPFRGKPTSYWTLK